MQTGRLEPLIHAGARRKWGSDSENCPVLGCMNTSMFILTAALIAVYATSHCAPLREQRFQLSIEGGPLTSVIEQFSEQTGLHIGMEISATNSRANDFGPFNGQATADEVMKKLLAGTDLWYAWR